MQIKGRHLLEAFGKKHPHARNPLERWLTISSKAVWKTPKDVKAVFSDVSFVGETTIFNIGGNKYRLLSYILYSKQTILINNVLTHEDYDKLTIA